MASPLTCYPVAGANSPCDGPVNKVSANLTWDDIVVAAGNQGGLESTATDRTAGCQASTTTNQFQRLNRSGYNFDTSSIGAGQQVDTATFSLYGNFKENALGSDSYDCVDFNPVATNAIPASEFINFGSVSFANITYAGFSTTNYNNWSLNTNGKANINMTGISSFGVRSNWDITGTFGGSWVSVAGSRFNAYFADQGGTSSDPKLVVVYSPTGGITHNNLTLLGVT